MIPPVATYRIQLRAGVDFAAVEAILPYLQDLGISHLYLSPIFMATAGSTHGYDVIDPTRIDPVLGGEAGFTRLAAAATRSGLGIILDIVPNHTAFSLENPWLRDVLRHGPASRFSRHFDYDTDRPLLLPMLNETFESKLAKGQVGIARAADGPVLRIGKVSVPLSPGIPVPDRADADALRALHAGQHWRLAHWEMERDAITHRRFFNITSLIGMRVEDPAVFDDTHATVLRLAGEGLIQGLRLDHIDGLADPSAYLTRLRLAVGDMPVWVEKILTGGEQIPLWPVEGTTGYEAGRAIVMALTDPSGLERITKAWRAATGTGGSFHDALMEAKREVIDRDLSAELNVLTDLAGAVIDECTEIEAGETTIRESIRALLLSFPRYRTYFGELPPRTEDLAVLAAATDDAAAMLRSDTTLRHLATAIARGVTPAQRALATRFQQVTGALLAKSHEDTAGFRFNAYLAANEVGADPDDTVLSPAALGVLLSHRQQSQPLGLTLTSSHDTKRSEDARMRLVAISHLPDEFLRFWAAACTIPEAARVPANTLWYFCQSFIAIWEDGRADIPERLAAHMLKALREAKEITTWSHPQEDIEQRIVASASAVAKRWMTEPPPGLAALVRRAESLSLAQLALKMVMPGLPDIYQGTETGAYGLTDPDNRLPVDFAALARVDRMDGFARRKAILLRALLDLRQSHPGFFRTADCRIMPLPDGFEIRRATGDAVLSLPIRLDDEPEVLLGSVRAIRLARARSPAGDLSARDG